MLERWLGVLLLGMTYEQGVRLMTLTQHHPERHVLHRAAGPHGRNRLAKEMVMSQGFTPGGAVGGGPFMGRPGMQGQQPPQRSPLVPPPVGLAGQHGTRVVSGSRPVRL